VRSSTREELSLAVLGIRPVNEADIRHIATVAWNTARKLSSDQEVCEDITAAAVHKACVVIHGRRVNTVAALYLTIERAAIDYTRKQHVSMEVSRVAWNSEMAMSEHKRSQSDWRAQVYVMEPSHDPKPETRMVLEDVLAVCSERDRAILLMVAEGDQASEIAAALGTTMAAVKSRLCRIRAWANKVYGEVLA